MAGQQTADSKSLLLAVAYVAVLMMAVMVVDVVVVVFLLVVCRHEAIPRFMTLPTHVLVVHTVGFVFHTP